MAASVIGGLLSLRLFLPGIVGRFATQSRAVIAGAGDGVPLGALAAQARDMTMAAVLPFLVTASLVAVAAGLAQSRFALAPDAAKPRLSNLSWRRGLERLKPTQAGWDGLRTLIKLGVVGTATWPVIASGLPRLLQARRLDAGISEAAGMIWGLLVRTAVAAAVIAAVDYGLARLRIERSLRMTHQELRQEVKEHEGDPLVRSARRRRQHAMSRNRLIAVAGAAVVVTNPTHYAVALAFQTSDPAPRVVAKGTNRLAARIRREAGRHGVPVVENKPLARSLFRRVRVGQFVPTALYEAVAVVLAVAYRRRRRAA